MVDSTISVGTVDTELQFGSSDEASADTVRDFYKKTAIPADSVARAIAFAIEQPAADRRSQAPGAWPA